MSLPEDALSPTAPIGEWLSPDSTGRIAKLEDYERGGVALSDGTQGLLIKDWRGRLAGSDVRVSGNPYAVETTLFSAPGITELSITFDANMLPAVAYVQLGQAKLYWYDNTVPGFVTFDLPVDVSSVFVTFDDKRAPATTINRSDILLFYVRGANLCYRQQRERFNVERELAPVPGGYFIKKCGMTRGLRVQIELEQG